MTLPTKVVIVGAGPVGSLAALYAARRGHQVEVYELRPGKSLLPPGFCCLLVQLLVFDLRDPSTVPLNFTKSINLALSERGINALRHAGQPNLLQSVLDATIPMRGRMIHGKKLTGELYDLGQDYDAEGRTIFAIDRHGLNSKLLDVLDSLPNVSLFFNHKLTGADFRRCKAWLEAKDRAEQSNGRPREIEISFDLMIGADGAHSAVRYHMMKFSRMNYQQEYIDTLWCEFHIAPQEGTAAALWEDRFRISPSHLHIWPGRDFMFIAIPSEDGSFTCTLFMPSAEFSQLERDPSRLPDFFDDHFPGVTELIPHESLVESFKTNPHLPLISLKCKPYHHGSSGVIIGDAAHAMVPFYGQGMNAGMEDVRVLFEILDKHDDQKAETNNPHEDASSGPSPFYDRSQALAEYSACRAPDAHAINDLALENYVEMRSSVLSTRYRLRKYLEEFVSLWFPRAGWRTKYSRVSFSNEGYADVIENSDYQGRMLVRGFFAIASSPFVLGLGIFMYRHRAAIRSAINGMGGLRR